MSDQPGFALPIPGSLVDAIVRRAAKLAVAELRDQAQPTSPWLDTREAAEHLRKPLGTFRQEVSRGAWPLHREGKRVYFHRDELDRARRGRR